MEQSVRIAVVMAVRDVEPYVVEALDSVARQTHRHWTCVVVDDGSTDRTAALVEGYPDARVRLVRHTAPAGSAAARNTGLREVSADVPYVAYLDGDDVWLPDALEVLLRALVSRPDAVGSYGLAEYLNEESEPVRPGEHPRRQRDRRRVRGMGLVDVPGQQDATFSTMVVSGSIWPSATALHRRDVVARVGGFDEALRLQQDWDLYLRMSRDGPFAAVEHQVAWYRQHGTNVTHRTVERVYFQDAVRQKTWASPANTAAQRREAGRAWRALQQRRILHTALAASRAVSRRSPRSVIGTVGAVLVQIVQLVRPGPPPPSRRLIRMSCREV